MHSMTAMLRPSSRQGTLVERLSVSTTPISTWKTMEKTVMTHTQLGDGIPKSLSLLG